MMLRKNNPTSETMNYQIGDIYQDMTGRFFHHKMPHIYILTSVEYADMPDKSVFRLLQLWAVTSGEYKGTETFLTLNTEGFESLTKVGELMKPPTSEK